MAIATLADFKNGLGTDKPVPILLGILPVTAGRPSDMWTNQAPAGVAPTTAVVPTRTTLGALNQQLPNAGAGLQHSILAARFSATVAGQYMVVDRLSHQGGLSGIVTTAQTTNLPTAAITRGAAEGVMMGLSIYTQLGATATTVTVSYTNSAGVAGRTSPAIAIGGTGFREPGRILLVPLQDGDVGVQSVESVTVLATTGTAGAFGVVLFKPLYVVCVPDVSGVLPAAGLITGSVFGGSPAIPADACLSVIHIGTSTTALGAGAILVSEN